MTLKNMGFWKSLVNFITQPLPPDTEPILPKEFLTFGNKVHFCHALFDQNVCRKCEPDCQIYIMFMQGTNLLNLLMWVSFDLLFV